MLLRKRAFLLLFITLTLVELVICLLAVSRFFNLLTAQNSNSQEIQITNTLKSSELGLPKASVDLNLGSLSRGDFSDRNIHNIYYYYNYISSGDYDSARSLISSDINIDLVLEKYGNFNELIASKIIKLSDGVYLSRVLSLKIGEKVKVFEDIVTVDTDTKVLVKVDSTELFNLFFEVRCGIKFNSSDDLCMVFSSTDNDYLYFYYYGITEFPFIKLVGSLSSKDSIVLISGWSDVSSRYLVVEYFPSTKDLVLIDSLKFYPPEDISTEVFLDSINLCMEEGANKFGVNSFHPGGCLYDKYKDTDWIKENQHYIDNINKYEGIF